MANTITNKDNVIDSRDVIDRIEELDNELQTAFDEVSQERLDSVTEELEDALRNVNDELEETLGDSTGQEFVPITFSNYLADVLDHPTHPRRAQAKEYETLSEGTSYDDLEHFIKEVAEDDEHAMHEEALEYKELKYLADQCEGYGDWGHGETLIHEDHFVDYCQELVVDIGDLPKDLPDYLVIDWEATADNLKVDYMEVDFGGETYFMRA